MARRIAINGFGRIGRMVFRILDKCSDLEVVAVNDLTDDDTLAHLLEFDSVHRRFDGTIETTDGALIVNGKRVQTRAERNLSLIHI